MTSTRSASPARWSKEQIEHLRATHFALLAVAVGLVVLVLSAKRYNPILALAQIEEILDLRTHWSPDWIKAASTQFNVVAPEGCEDVTDCQSRFEPVAVSGDSLVRTAKLSNHREGTVRQGQRLQFSLPSPGWSLDSRADGVHWSPTSFPESMVEFEEWWDDLGKTPYAMLFPQEVATNGGEILDNNRLIGYLSVPRTPSIGAPTAGVVVPLTLWAEPQKHEVYYFGGHPGQLVWYKIPITRSLHVQVSQGDINNRYGHLTPGEFPNSFSDLQMASSPYQSLALERVESFLREDAWKGPEVFEALGVRFPASGVKVWGVVVLMTIQAYYAICLRSLSGSASEDPEVFGIPWIGLNTDLLGRSALVLTSVVLPVAAVTLLVSGGVRGAHLFELHSVGTARFVGGWALILVSSFLALMSWYLRPRGGARFNFLFRRIWPRDRWAAGRNASPRSPVQ